MTASAKLRRKKRQTIEIFTMCGIGYDVVCCGWRILPPPNVLSHSGDKIDALVNLIFCFIDFMRCSSSTKFTFCRSTRTKETYQSTGRECMCLKLGNTLHRYIDSDPYHTPRTTHHSLRPRWSFFVDRLYLSVVRIVSFATQPLTNMPHWRRKRFVFINFIRKQNVMGARVSVCLRRFEAYHISPII